MFHLLSSLVLSLFFPFSLFNLSSSFCFFVFLFFVLFLPVLFETHVDFNFWLSCCCFLVFVSCFGYFCKTPRFVQVKGCNITVLFKQPLLPWRVSKSSFLLGLLVCLVLVCLSENTISIVVSEKFETAHFHKGPFLRVGSGLRWKLGSGPMLGPQRKVILVQNLAFNLSICLGQKKPSTPFVRL